VLPFSPFLFLFLSFALSFFDILFLSVLSESAIRLMRRPQQMRLHRVLVLLSLPPRLHPIPEASTTHTNRCTPFPPLPASAPRIISHLGGAIVTRLRIKVLLPRPKPEPVALVLQVGRSFLGSVLNARPPPQPIRMHRRQARQSHTQRLAPRPFAPVQRPERRTRVIYGPELQECTTQVSALLAAEWSHCWCVSGGRLGRCVELGFRNS
jgi:hypothetical protein